MRYQKNLISSLLEEPKFALIILDACRANLFENLNHIDGDYQRVYTPGKNTLEWLHFTFRGFHAITYVSGNPHVSSRLAPRGFAAFKHFEETIDVWHFGWDDELGTVPPWEINDAVPCRDRIIIHYMQPHPPYIGTPQITVPQKCDVSAPSFGMEPMQEYILQFTPRRIREAYKGNLKLVLDYVEQLLPRLSGKIIITSDHGELLGEKNQWFHSGKTRDLDLVMILQFVPWLEVGKQ